MNRTFQSISGLITCRNLRHPLCNLFLVTQILYRNYVSTWIALEPERFCRILRHARQSNLFLFTLQYCDVSLYRESLSDSKNHSTTQHRFIYQVMLRIKKEMLAHIITSDTTLLSSARIRVSHEEKRLAERRLNYVQFKQSLKTFTKHSMHCTLITLYNCALPEISRNCAIYSSAVLSVKVSELHSTRVRNDIRTCDIEEGRCVIMSTRRFIVRGTACAPAYCFL